MFIIPQNSKNRNPLAPILCPQIIALKILQQCGIINYSKRGVRKNGHRRMYRGEQAPLATDTAKYQKRPRTSRTETERNT